MICHDGIKTLLPENILIKSSIWLIRGSYSSVGDDKAVVPVFVPDEFWHVLP